MRFLNLISVHSTSPSDADYTPTTKDLSDVDAEDLADEYGCVCGSDCGEDHDGNALFREEYSDYDDSEFWFDRTWGHGAGELERMYRNEDGQGMALSDSRLQLAALPLDVLFEIFSLLKPRRLVRLARTCKSIRNILLSPSAAFVWKAARSAVYGPPVPAPPEGMSEVTLAHVLFGDKICALCWTRGTIFNFWLTRGPCSNCLTLMVVPLSIPDDVDDETDASGLRLSRACALGNDGLLLQADDESFWMTESDQDIFEAKREVAKAECREDEFLAQRFQYLQSISDSRTTFQEWSDATIRWRKERTVTLAAQNREFILPRLLDVGHAVVDVESNHFQAYVEELARRHYIIDESTWKDWCAPLGRCLAHAKAEREYIVVRDRKSRVTGLYDTYCKELLPAQWNYLPPGSAIFEFQPFKTLVDSDPSRVISDEEWEAAADADELPAYLTRVMRAMCDAYTAKLPAGYGADAPCLDIIPCHSPQADDLRVSGRMPQFGGPLDLAVSVFEFDDAALIGSELFAAWSQGLLPSQADVLPFSTRGSRASEELVVLLGLDPSKASASALDRLDSRVICVDCSAANNDLCDGLLAYSWRSAVEHFMAADEAGHPKPRWQILEAEQADDVRTREAKPQRTQWLCNRCTVKNVERSNPTDSVTAHLRQVHGIRGSYCAVEDRDFVHWIVEHLTRPKSVLVIDGQISDLSHERLGCN